MRSHGPVIDGERGGCPVSDVSVFIIDDDYDIRDAMAEILEDQGYSVACASDGGDALEKLKGLRPKLILLDLNMPRVNGAEFRAAQREEPSIAEIPTVVMTAGDRMSERVAEIAPTDTIAKPIELSTLFSVVAQYCGEA